LSAVINQIQGRIDVIQESLDQLLAQFISFDPTTSVGISFRIFESQIAELTAQKEALLNPPEPILESDFTQIIEQIQSIDIEPDLLLEPVTIAPDLPIQSQSEQKKDNDLLKIAIIGGVILLLI